jgi:imidazolonepropionase-like amidohydrolase
LLGADRLHLHGVRLPDGEAGDVWVADGVVRLEPVRDAITLCRRGFLLPGLVDAHCHIGLESTGAVPADVAERHALTERAAGALLLRDAGSPADTRWMDARDDLPRLLRAGRHIARPKRYLPHYGAEIEPEELVAEVERQARRGDGWVKLVGDWIDREVGDLAPLWPVAEARAAIARAHQLGARVTAHVFGEQAVTELVEAGIDGIEHGTGIAPELIGLMAERQVALVPTMLQLDNFERYAAQGQARFPRYAAHMRHLYRRRLDTFAAAHDAGVPIYAGTDAGGYLPHGLVAAEIAALAPILGVDTALAAGSWAARRWLGNPDVLTDGGPADLVVLDDDPRVDLGVLRAPRFVVLRGRVVEAR